MSNQAKSHPDLAKLLIAQVPADFADWLDFVAIGALLAFTWQVDPVVFAFLAVAMGLPYLIIGPFAGVLVDRTDTKTGLVLSNLGRAATTLSLFFAPDWPTLIVLVALRSAVDSFFTPAKQAAIQSLSTPKTRTRANSISHGINQASKIFAPSIGGALLIWTTPHVIFLLNTVVSMIAVALFLRMAPLPSTLDTDSENEDGIFQTLKKGFSEVRGKPILRNALGMMAAGYFAMFFYDTLIAPLTRQLGFTETDLGLTIAAVGAGGVLGAVGMSLIKYMPRPFAWIAAGAFISAITVFGLGAADVFALPIAAITFFACFFILGIATSLTVIPFRTVIQNTVTESAMGRVTSISEALNTIALLTAPFIGALIASLSTFGMAFIFGAFVMLGVGIQAVRLRNGRQL